MEGQEKNIILKKSRQWKEKRKKSRYMCSGRASNWEMAVKVKGVCSKREEQKMNVKQKEANADVRRKKH